MMKTVKRTLVKLGLRRSPARVALPFVAAGGTVIALGAASALLFPRVRDFIRGRTMHAYANGH